MKRLLLLTTIIILVACGPSTQEKEEIAILTCNIMGASRNMDGAARIKEINAAREQIGEDRFLGSDDKIKESFKHELCKELVLNDPGYNATIEEMDRLAKEMDRLAKEAEQTRIDALVKLMCAEGGTCIPGDIDLARGDVGPAGGIVIYISQDGRSGMEAALVDAGDVPWGCDGITVATSQGIGTGYANTDAIIAKCGQSTAAYLAANYTWPNGQKGGFLPSKDELNLLYKQKIVVGGFANDYYWSSSEGNSGSAWYQVLSNGLQDYSNKSGPSLVRAVRAF